jgi:hypothetical protein
MPRETLILFIQSENVDSYVNPITHCVNKEQVTQIYFVGNKDISGKEFELQEIAEKLRNRIDTLSENHQEYKDPSKYFPGKEKINSRIIRIPLETPQEVISIFRDQNINITESIIDVTGCTKLLACSILTAFISSGINHICHFELATKVSKSDWNKSKLYHDLIGDVSYYEYKDFSKSTTINNSIKKLRRQGRLIKFLFLLCFIFACLVAFLFKEQRTYTGFISIIFLGLITGFGAFSDSLTIVDRLRQKLP